MLFCESMFTKAASRVSRSDRLSDSHCSCCSGIMALSLQGAKVLHGPRQLSNKNSDGCLAEPGAAGNHQDLGNQRKADRRLLAISEDQTGPMLDPRQGFVRVDPWPREPTVHEPHQPVGDTTGDRIAARRRGSTRRRAAVRASKSEKVTNICFRNGKANLACSTPGLAVSL